MKYDKNNIFAKIIRGEIKADIFFENEFVLAFFDISKAAPTHLLVVPKGEFIDFVDFSTNASSNEITSFFQTIAKIAQEIGAVENGFRLITNNGSDAHQTVKHFHIHLLAGKKLGPLLSSDNKLR